MEKKSINIVFIISFIFYFLVLLYGGLVVCFDNLKVKNSVVEVEERILSEDFIGEVEEIVEEDFYNEENASSVGEVVGDIVEDGNDFEDDAIGIITFKNGKSVAIYDNPSDYNMNRGIGKLNNGAILNKSGNNILLGHRETGMYELRNIKVGDILEIKNSCGIVKYKVESTCVVEKDDPFPYKSSDELKLTLITCYPFNYNGNAPKRFVVVGNVVK